MRKVTSGSAPSRMGSLIGTGKTYSDFAWTGPIAATPNLPNTSQTLPIVENQIDGFSIYPNPVHSQLTVLLNELQNEDLLCKIIDLNGKLHKSLFINNQENMVDVSRLSKGVYLIQVTSSDGVFIEKFIKE